MGRYVYGLICASLALGALELLIPENAKTRPYVRLIFGLAMVLAVAKPMGQLVAVLPELIYEVKEEELEAEGYEEMSEQQLCRAYKEGAMAALKEKFGLKSFEVGVSVGEDRKPSKITVTLMDGDIFRNPYKIEEYVTDTFGCECVTVIG